MGSENGHVCLLSVHRGRVGGSEKVQKPAHVIFEWSLMKLLKKGLRILFKTELKSIALVT